MFIYLSFCLCIYLSFYLSLYLSLFISIYLSASISLSISSYLYLCLSISICLYLSLPLSISTSIYLYLYLSLPLSISLSLYLSICKFENEAILRDFLNFWTWQRQKRTNSAGLPQCLKLTTSKTKQFCETSSTFEIDNIKNEAILRDFLQKWKVECRADGLDLSTPPVWSTAPATKKWCQVIRSAAPVTQGHFPKTEDLRFQNATPLRNSAPGPPNISDDHVCCTAPAMRKTSCQILCICPTPAIVLGNATTPSSFAPFWQGAQSLAPATSERPKVLWTRQFFYTFDFETCFAPQLRALFRHLDQPVSFLLLTSICASRHNGVHFFHITTSKSNSERGVFCTFWLRNVLRATTACTFSTSQLPKVIPSMVCFVHFYFETCFAPQRRALFRHRNF